MWRCEQCGQHLEETFDVCWSCGTNQDGTLDPSFSPEPNDYSVPDPGPDNNPYSSPSGSIHFASDNSVDVNNLSQTRKMVLFLSVSSVFSMLFFLMQFGGGIWWAWKVRDIGFSVPFFLDRIFWRFILAIWSFIFASALWRYAREIHKSIALQSIGTERVCNLQKMLAAQATVWVAFAIFVAVYVGKQICWTIFFQLM